MTPLVVWSVVRTVSYLGIGNVVKVVAGVVLQILAGA
jgi:hypothetical protein